jgi:DNA-binding transcriptional regulator LsrR (DeoR family)
MARPSKPTDVRLLTKISRLYYEDGLGGGEIAEKLNLSRSKVSRLLSQARQTGIVKIMVVTPPGIHSDLEKQLETHYGLKEAVVADISDLESRDQATRAIGAAAASHLQETLQSGDVIGISWGRTLNAMVEAAQVQRAMNNHIVQIIGGLGPPTANVHATDLCQRLASALGGELTLLHAPGIVDTKEARDVLQQDSHAGSAQQYFRKIDIAYVGIGAPTPDAIMIQDGSIMRQEDLQNIVKLGAVGDIALRFFDENGAEIESELNERVIGITLEQLRQARRVVGVSGGANKVQAIKGALLGGYIDVLVTDHETAEKLAMLPE